MLNQINEGTGKDILQAFGGIYPVAARAGMGDRITDATYQDILTRIAAVVAGSGGGGGTPTVATGLQAKGSDQASALELTADINVVDSSTGLGYTKLPAATPVGKSVTVIIVGQPTTGSLRLLLFPHVGGNFVSNPSNPAVVNEVFNNDKIPGTNTGGGSPYGGSYTFTRITSTLWALTVFAPIACSNA